MGNKAIPLRRQTDSLGFGQQIVEQILRQTNDGWRLSRVIEHSRRPCYWDEGRTSELVDVVLVFEPVPEGQQSHTAVYLHYGMTAQLLAREIEGAESGYSFAHCIDVGRIGGVWKDQETDELFEVVLVFEKAVRLRRRYWVARSTVPASARPQAARRVQ